MGATGRTVNRWENSVKMDIREIGYNSVTRVTWLSSGCNELQRGV
jgi:hypothetical protein